MNIKRQEKRRRRRTRETIRRKQRVEKLRKEAAGRKGFGDKEDQTSKTARKCLFCCLWTSLNPNQQRFVWGGAKGRGLRQALGKKEAKKGRKQKEERNIEKGRKGRRKLEQEESKKEKIID